MIWIRLILTLVIMLMAIYYVMLLFQCVTDWFKFTNRKITFKRCLIPFYYWIAPINEGKKNKPVSDYADEESHETETREKNIKEKTSFKKTKK